MSKSEIENMTMAQKKMAAMIMEGKQVPDAAVESGAVSQEADDAEMQMSDDEADELVKKFDHAAVQEAKVAQNAAQGPIKVSYSHFLHMSAIWCPSFLTSCSIPTDSQRLHPQITETEESCYIYLPYLWTTNSRERDGGACPYRTPRSTLEGKANGSRCEAHCRKYGCRWNRRISLFTTNRFEKNGHLCRIARRRGSQTQSGRRRSVAKEREGNCSMGWLYKFCYHNNRKIPVWCKSRPANCCSTQSQGSYRSRKQYWSSQNGCSACCCRRGSRFGTFHQCTWNILRRHLVGCSESASSSCATTATSTTAAAISAIWRIPTARLSATRVPSTRVL